MRYITNRNKTFHNSFNKYFYQREVCKTDSEIKCANDINKPNQEFQCLEKCTGLQVTSYETIPTYLDSELNEIISNLSHQYNEYKGASMPVDFKGKYVFLVI